MAAFALDISVCWLVSKKYPVATEFICPVFVACVYLACIPLYYDSLDNPTIIEGQSLLQILNILYIFLLILSMFFDGNYMVSLIARLLCYILVLWVVLRRKFAGDAVLGPLLFNYVTILGMTEFNAYNINRKTVGLFLEKESSKKNDKEKGDILQN